MSKKEIAEIFLKLASAGKVEEAYDNYVHPDFIHHNAYFAGDRETLKTAMAENAARFSATVWALSRLRRCTNRSGGSAGSGVSSISPSTPGDTAVKGKPNNARNSRRRGDVEAKTRWY